MITHEQYLSFCEQVGCNPKYSVSFCCSWESGGGWFWTQEYNIVEEAISKGKETIKKAERIGLMYSVVALLNEDAITIDLPEMSGHDGCSY